MSQEAHQDAYAAAANIHTDIDAHGDHHTDGDGDRYRNPHAQRHPVGHADSSAHPAVHRLGR
jgi:hypothetical protein